SLRRGRSRPRHRSVRWVLACCLALALAGLTAAASAATGNPDLISRASGANGAKENNNSLDPAISAEGRFVAFDSIASKSHPHDGDDRRDVYRRRALATAEQAARISIDDVTMAEGDSGQTAFRFTVSLDQAQSAPVTVDFATPAGVGTATAPSDYTAASGTVSFAPGETAKTITVQVNGDTTVEPDETFF